MPASNRSIASILRVATVAAALFGAGQALAQAPGRALTLDDALRLAKENNRDLKATREHLRQAYYDILGPARALSPLLPTVNVQGKYTVNNKEIPLQLVTPPTAGSLQDLQNRAQVGFYGDLAPQTSAQTQALLAQVAGYCMTNKNDPQCVCEAKPNDPSCTIIIQKRNQLDFTASATVPLIVPYAYPALRAAKSSYASQEESALATEAQLLLAVATAFYGAAGTDELVGARQHGVQVAKQTLDNARARLEAGVSNRVDVTRAEQALVRAQQALLEAIANATTSQLTLATLIQLREPFHVLSQDEPPRVNERAEGFVSDGLKLRPEIRALDRQLSSADDTVLSAKLRWAPSLSGFALFRAYNASGFAGDNYAWGLGLQLDWLIYDGGIRLAQQRQFESVQVETALRQAQLRDTIADEITIAHGTIEVKRQAVEAARREVALADETLKLVRVQRDAGTATQLDLLQAQDALIQAEVSVARARFELGLSYLQLRRAAGQFPAG